MTDYQKYLYRNICIDHAYDEKMKTNCTNAHLIILEGFVENPNVEQVMEHLEYLIEQGSHIFGVSILLRELLEAQ